MVAASTQRSVVLRRRLRATAVDNLEEDAMEPLIARCAGLDVHKETVAVGVRVPGPTGARGPHVRTGGTMTAARLAVREWLTAPGVRPVALERTGVSWKPSSDVLEEAVTCLLVKAAPRRNVPGRKTDVQDGVWIAQWLAHGLRRGRFVPPGPSREWRDLTRSRKRRIQERVRETPRLQKGREEAGVQRASVATDSRGGSGRAMLDARVPGTTAPEGVAELARGRRRAKRPAVRAAWAGRVRGQQGLLVSELLAHLDDRDEAIARVSQQIEEPRRPFAARGPPLNALPGLKQRALEGSVAESGIDRSPCPSDRQLVSGAGLCPGHQERAGQGQSGRTRNGTRWRRTALIDATVGAIRVKDRRLAARYRRIMRQRGHKTAVGAVAHTIRVILSHRRKHQGPSQEVGAASRDQRDRAQATRRYGKQVARLGHRVILERAACQRGHFQSRVRDEAEDTPREMGARSREGGSNCLECQAR